MKIIIIFLMSFIFVSACFGDAGVKVLETQYANIVYNNQQDLNELSRRIGANGDVILRVDLIMRRVSSISGIDIPKDFQKINVFLRTDYNLTKQDIISTYNSTTNTILIYTDTVTDGVLAHEFMHALLNQVYKGNMSAITQEILCQYIDSHLYEGF